jgi:hypothetical protein
MRNVGVYYPCVPGVRGTGLRDGSSRGARPFVVDHGRCGNDERENPAGTDATDPHGQRGHADPTETAPRRANRRGDRTPAFVVPTLAARIARQLVIKCDAAHLRRPSTWSALGTLVQRDVERLLAQVGLVERQVIVALPKLSAAQIEGLLGTLRSQDPRIARTVLNTALDAADPVAAAHRYLKQFHAVADRLRRIDPDIARRFANGAFMARAPLQTALDHFDRFAEVIKSIRGNVPFARLAAREACRAPDPVAAATRCIADYTDIVNTLTARGVQIRIARSLAGMACTGATPLETATTLLERFTVVLKHVRATHPVVARTIALSACRSSDPIRGADTYMNNYDTVVRMIRRTDPRRAHSVATQAFRSDKPLAWAKRYLTQLQSCGVSQHPE